ncbi:thiosulfate oxidation carrier protein SoxY [Candidatus Reidiella endopervernicosa]|uniref:Thiosulfate oxidation carrier protein SoxY n=2 Tax=Gammaproteobacteria incertae sedis TaxID=118884 RepID=A0A6N0HSU9_9GAMM|nr:thiosulfate oxidation carrier protein SoxY [Candidatus Reidiella endopervernicosa]QKQ25424.1 thiosulfate oxidation carrier protein SoxY [Candidatus Reidiella endopervernicosa]
MNNQRRTFLKGSLAAGTVGVAVGAGLLAPRAVMAAWPKAAFEANDFGAAISGVAGSSDAADSGDVKIKAPDIAENGAVVPITVSTSLPNVESITILSANNNTPLSASFNLSASAEGFVSTRIKMGKTSDVVAVVKSGGKLFKSSKNVKVTIGGCGG